MDISLSFDDAATVYVHGIPPGAELPKDAQKTSEGRDMTTHLLKIGKVEIKMFVDKAQEASA